VKVLHAAETIKGGVATVMKSLLKDQYSRFGHNQVRALIPQDHLQELETVPKNIVFTFKRKKRSISGLVWFSIQFIKMLIQFKPDVVHLHSTFSGFLGRLILILLRPFYRPSVIYCPHAFAFLMEGSQNRRKLFAWIERLLAKGADVIICVGEYEKKQAQAWGIPAEKMRVVHNGVSPLEKTAEKTPISESNLRKLLFVGRFDYQKGFDIILDLIPKLKPGSFSLTIVGAAVNSSQKPKEFQGVTYTGWLKPDELALHYAQADVVLIPSRWEGFAMVPLEAMRAKCAILATNTTSLPEVVTDGENGRLLELSPCLADEMAEIIKNTPIEEWRRMGEAGFDKFLAEFTESKMVEHTAALYQEKSHA